MLFIDTDAGRMLCMSVTPPWPLAPVQRSLLEVFCQRIGAAFDNLHMVERLREKHDEAVAALARLAGAPAEQGGSAADGWHAGAGTLSAAIAEELLRQRLVERWRGYGLTPAEIEAKIEGNDLPNGRYVKSSSKSADLVLWAEQPGM